MKNPIRLSRNTVVQWDPEQITTEIAGEVIAMSIRQGVYVGLDAVASNIWKRLSTPQSIESVCSQLISEFRGDPEVIASDVVELLSELRELGMVTTHKEVSATGAVAAA
jgi:hypothetical protein